MAPVRDVLALILGCLVGAVWAVYMIALILRGESPDEKDWAILPTATAALLGAIYAMTGRTYQARHVGSRK